MTLDVATPDRWGDFRRKREILIGIGPELVENTPFTADEQSEIAEHVRHIRELVKEAFALPEPRTLSLAAKLDNIEAVAGRIGRKDWQFVFYGAMHSVRLLSPDSFQHLLVASLHGLDHLFGGAGQGDSRPVTAPREACGR